MEKTINEVKSEAKTSVISTRFNIALTQSNFQVLQNKADSLIFNSDHIEEIAKYLKDLRAVVNQIDQTHKSGKAEALKVCQEWDAVRRTFLDMVGSVLNPVQQKYEKICREVQQQREQEERERQRKINIKKTIETKVLSYSSMIAECSTLQELTNIERRINLEKTRKDIFQEFFDEAFSQFTALNKLLSTQKDHIKELEAIRKKELEALKNNDEETLIEVAEKKEAVNDQIEEAKITIQESAINQALKEEEFIEPEVIYPTVKARRTVWRWKVIDMKETAKRMPSWIEMSVNEKKVDDYLKAKKAEGINEEEFIVAGVRFYLDKTY